MAQIICVIGNKGGTGKTTLSHMLCQGLGLLGHRSACILTDTSRTPLSPEGRRYITADARSEIALGKVIEKLRSLDNWIGIVDGGGNRTEVDRKLYALSDIVLLPFRESHEDIRTVLRDLEMFPRAYAVPSQWPTNAWQREAADRQVGQMMLAYTHRILHPVSALSSSKLLLQKQMAVPLPTALSNACRSIARQILDILDIHDLQNESGQTAEEPAPLPEAEMPLRLKRNVPQS